MSASEGGSDRGSGEAQTLREELGSIVRETAIEVLGPVMRTATKSAAKYAVRKAPEMAMERVLPKLRELQSTVEDAGGRRRLREGNAGIGIRRWRRTVEVEAAGARR